MKKLQEQTNDMSAVTFDERGLVPVVVQDYTTGEVLMLAYANEEALRLTQESGELYLFSRSRKRLWHKGETSGNVMKVRRLTLDCDGDAVLALVCPEGPACHTGHRSCFFEDIMKGPDGDATFPGKLWQYLLRRKGADPKESYTAKLISQGLPRVAQKVGEEGVELAIALTLNDKGQIIYEASDLVYHVLVSLIAAGVSIDDVRRELASRHGEKL